RTTFIVGFPGETEEDFEELCAFVDEAKFDRMGTFAYSREEGTPAYDFRDQIDEQVKQDRADIIMSQQYRINAELNERFLHKTLKVLVEDYDVVAETYYGRSYMDAPEIDGKIYFSSKKKLKPGTFAQVKIDEIGDYDLLGHAL
ncbi:MAG: 30S ribosomal protein S12 methylthiotransferase RimO, partial [Clostridia bacterium]|nr:30S ribosomal protein S12 methylthiotransferase RimO [Clostridia bacterium]